VKRPDYEPENGFLLERPPVERVTPKSDYLLRLEAKQGSKEAAAELARRVNDTLEQADGSREKRKRPRNKVVSISQARTN